MLNSKLPFILIIGFSLSNFSYAKQSCEDTQDKFDEMRMKKYERISKKTTSIGKLIKIISPDKGGIVHSEKVKNDAYKEIVKSTISLKALCYSAEEEEIKKQISCKDSEEEIAEVKKQIKEIENGCLGFVEAYEALSEIFRKSQQFVR